MQAVRIQQFGGPEVFEIEDVPTPEPGPGEVLIQVHAASANPVDYKLARGTYRDSKARPPFPVGRDVAGIVERCGPGVTDFEPGDPVMAMLDPTEGGFAERVATKASNCAPKPNTLEDKEAAAVPLAAITAWQGLFDQGGLSRGQSVLIHGAAGGVGHLAVQLAKAEGATVFATCAHEDKSFVERLGADEAIAYDTERFEDRIKEVDVVFDLVGGETQDRSWSVLSERGVMVSTVSQPSQDKAKERKAQGKIFMAKANGKELAVIGRLIDDGEVEPIVDSVFALEDVSEAERRLEEGGVRGKIVVAVA